MMRRAAVLGHPVGHSRSPSIFNYWFRQYDIEGEYTTIDVPPEQFATAIRGLRQDGFAGVNVTIPHKQRALQIADTATPVARAAGAANILTFDRKTGQIDAECSDGAGFVASIRAAIPGWDPKAGRIVILGAGGAARAIAAEMAMLGVPEICVVNRTLDRAKDLVQCFDVPGLVYGWKDAADAMAKARLLVNATSLGMQGQPPLEVDLSGLGDDAVVVDIVYVPHETGLLQQAREAGLVTVEGTGMLLHQARPAFRRWYGIDPEVSDCLFEAVFADLA